MTKKLPFIRLALPQPAATITRLVLRQRRRQAKLISLTSPAFARTPIGDAALVVGIGEVGGVVCGSISTTMSSFRLTGVDLRCDLIGKSWRCQRRLNERSSVFDVVTNQAAEPRVRLTTERSILDLVVGTEAEPHRFVLAAAASATADEDASR